MYLPCKRKRQPVSESSSLRVTSLGNNGVSTIVIDVEEASSYLDLVFLFLVRAAHQIDPTIPDRIPDYEHPKDLVYPISVDNTKSKQLLGLKYTDKYTCMKDTAAQFKQKGWY